MCPWFDAGNAVGAGKTSGFTILPADTMAERLTRYVGYTTPYNVVGAPAMSVPSAWSSAGLPIGAQFGAAVGGEALLLGLAYELEETRPWAARRPGEIA